MTTSNLDLAETVSPGVTTTPPTSSRQETPWWAMPETDVLAKLNTDLTTGLTDAEVAKRRQQYGPNAFPEEEQKSVWASLIAAFSDRLVIILTAAAALSAIIGVAEGSSQELQQAGWIMGIVIFMTLVGYFTDKSADNALQKLKELQKVYAQVIRNGKKIEVDAEELVPGDVIVLKQGSGMAADARIIQATDATASEKTLTGENETNKADGILSEDTPLADRENMVFSGTFIHSGEIYAVVTGTGLNTELGKIYDKLKTTEDTITPLQRQLAQLGDMLMVGTVVVCVTVVLIYIFVQDYDPVEALVVAVALAIAFIPEALGAIITIALALGVREMVTKKAIIRQLRAAEGLGSVSIVCTDKTGTITYGLMTATHLWTQDHGTEVIEKIDMKTRAKDYHRLLEVIRFANNLGDASERALGKLAEIAGFVISSEDIMEREAHIPFTSTRKRMSTVRRANGRRVLRSKGAPESLLDRCKYMLRNHTVVEMTDADRALIIEQVDRFANEGYRVFAFAERDLSDDVIIEGDGVEQELTFVGLVALSDPARPEVRETVAILRKAGITAKMITGDNPRTALSIAKDVGLVPADATLDAVIEGRVLKTMTPASGQRWSEENVKKVVNAAIFARVTPDDKVSIVEALQQSGNLTAMTGDGVNDAPALKKADVGIAIEPCTDMAREVSDVVLTGTYEAIASAVQVGRTILYRARLYIHALLSTNGAEVGMFILAAVAGWPVPLTAIQLLVINLLGDSWLSMALATEKEEADVMQQPPRPSNEPVITRYMWLSIGLQSLISTGVMTAAFLIARDHTVNSMGLAAESEPALAIQRTAIFISFMTQKILRSAFTARSLKYNLWEIGFFTNKWSLYAAALTVVIALMAIYVLPVGMEPVPSTILPALFAIGLVPPIAEEAVKFVRKMAT